MGTFNSQLHIVEGQPQAHFAVISGETQRGCQYYGDFANDLERYKEACQEVGQDCGWDNLDHIFYQSVPSHQ